MYLYVIFVDFIMSNKNREMDIIFLIWCSFLLSELLALNYSAPYIYIRDVTLPYTRHIKHWTWKHDMNWIFLISLLIKCAINWSKCETNTPIISKLFPDRVYFHYSYSPVKVFQWFFFLNTVFFFPMYNLIVHILTNIYI